MARELEQAAKARRDDARQDCLAFADAIIAAWEPERSYRWNRREGADRNVFPRLLIELDDPNLLRDFLEHVLARDGQLQLDKSFSKFCKRHGWSDFESSLSAVIGAASEETVARNAELLRIVAAERDKNAQRIELCHHLAARYVEALMAFDQAPAEHAWRTAPVDRGSLLVAAVRAMLAVHAESSLGRLIDHITSQLDKYDLTDVQLASLFALHSQLAKVSEPNRAICRWLTFCRGELERRTAQPPREPTDYRRSDKLSCDCSLCRELATFLADRVERQRGLPLRKDLRQHLHRVIDESGCDLTHATRRQGRPDTLVCTKTTASYEKACQIYERDRKNLARLIAMGEKARAW